MQALEDNIRENIPRAALAMFDEKSHGASMREIAHHINMTICNIYWHFNIKENILISSAIPFTGR